ncbi:MAG: iron-sulfur cluster assembly scaffold protein [Nanoarchaeota archaeon]|nr:iron-sulfur cluster assembly scaffold protein [Nanoarchaeota archaeon]
MYTDKVMKRFKKPKNVGVIKNADGVGEVGNMKCLPGMQKVHINNKIIDMAELKPRNRIVSHDGKYHNISKIHKRRHSGKLVGIKSKLGITSLTGDHLIYAIKFPKKRRYFDTKVKKMLIPAWYHADTLEKRDILLYPIFNEILDKKYINTDLSTKKYDFSSIKIPKQIALNRAFLRLCGYFLAEGHANVKSCRNNVTFAFNINERKYIQDVRDIVKSIFGLETYVGNKPERKTAVVIINNVFVAKLFKELFGSGAANKKIPDFMMLLPPKKQKHLICGMWRGDGHITLKREWPRASYTTISEQLTHQMKTLLLRQRIAPSLYFEKAYSKVGVHHKAAYRIHIGDRNSMRSLMEILGLHYFYCKKQKDCSWFDENYFYTPISGYEMENYRGDVFDIEVPETHSFATNSLLAHNCGDVMKVYIRVEKNKIKDIRFETFGCVAAIASSDALCDLAKGKTLDKALKITDKDIAKELGGLPCIKLHCSVLGSNALKKAIEDYKKKISFTIL